jgi:siderophore synthetase component
MIKPALSTYSREREERRSDRAPHMAPDEHEQRVIRQLVEALLFEGVVAHELRPRPADSARSDDFEPIYDREIRFKVGARLCRSVAATKAFGRVRVAQGSVERLVQNKWRPCTLFELVTSLDIDAEAQRRLLAELDQTVALCRWNGQNLPHARDLRRGLSFQQLESAIVEGHPYHPCFKARTGFSLQDHRDYGPEAGNTFQLHWLAIAKTSLRTALPHDDATFWRRELGASEHAALTERLEHFGASWIEYSLVPIHPWQLQAIFGLGLDRAIAAREVVPLGSAGERYHASQSVRTLLNASTPEKANVKLPLDIVCTSTRRNLQPHFVCTAPALSEWLSSLVAEDPFLQSSQKLLILKEYAGMIYEPEAEALHGRIGAVYRESVCSKLAPDEEAVPFTALTLVEADGRPFIEDWLSAHGTDTWVERLIEVVLIPIWHLLVHHGVAFESHAQNLILVHRDGLPEKIVLRDFHEDTELVPDYLRAPEKLPDFARIHPFFETIPEDDGYRMASIEDLRELFMDCVYVYNLADLSFLLERFFGFREQDFWNVVRAQLRRYERSGVTEKARIDRIGSDSAEIIVESLLKKKLMNGALLDCFEHRARNTLNG